MNNFTISSFSSLQTLDRALTKKGHSGAEHKNAFAAVLDYDTATSKELALIFSPLGGVSFLIKAIHGLINDSFKENDVITLHKAILSLNNDTLSVNAGRFRIEQLADSLSITDIVSGESKEYLYPENGDLLDFQNSLFADVNAINNYVRQNPDVSVIVKNLNDKLLDATWSENIFRQLEATDALKNETKQNYWAHMKNHFKNHPMPKDITALREVVFSVVEGDTEYYLRWQNQTAQHFEATLTKMYWAAPQPATVHQSDN